MASVTIQILNGAAAGKVFTSDADVVRIGRAGSSEVTLSEQHVSAEHARLLTGDSEVVLEDLDSTNGTWAKTAPGSR
jgi:two-component system cell cycle response regulator